ncbi:MAG: sulfatase [Planctomycetota bacterium]|nr:sulfatase [Planctomycetota bacterium]
MTSCWSDLNSIQSQALACALVWLAGCGGADEPAPRPARFLALGLEPVGLPPAFPEGEILAHWNDFKVGRQHLDWDFLGARHWVGVYRDRPVLRVDRSGPVKIEIPIQVRFRDECVVTVMATVPGQGAGLTASLTADGRTLGRQVQRVPSMPDIQAIAFHIEANEPGMCVPYRLVLDIEADSAPLGILGISMLEAVEGMGLGADVFGGHALVEIAGDARVATALSGVSAVEASFDVDTDGGRLQFAYGRPLALRRGIGPGQLRLRLEGEGGTVRESLFDLRRGRGASVSWRDVSMDLGPWRGRRVRVVFDLAGVEDETLCLLSQPHLLHPGQGAPTVLVVTSDTHRADHVGFVAGVEALDTRAIDRLAAEGVAFLDAVSSANNTTPSHVALFTGLSPRDTGLVANRKRLSGEALTLAETFRDLGYATLAVTSATPVKFASSGLGQGFDRYSSPGHRPSRTAGETVDQALEWLDELEGVPVFLWVHVFDAHGPYEPPDDLQNLYYTGGRDPFDADAPGADRRLAPTWNFRIADPDYTEALYKGEITALDRQLSRLLSLERVRAGITAFTADHGEVLRHGRERSFDHGGLSLNTLAVPLILRAPGLEGGVLRSDPVRQIDVGRTLLDLSGHRSAHFPGRGLLREGSMPRFAIEANGISASIISGSWMLRLFLRGGSAGRDGQASEVHSIELFDLGADHFCLKDVAPAHPELCARLRAALVRWLGEASEHTLVTSSLASDSEVARQLATLGYVAMEDAETSRWFDGDCECTWCARYE